MPPWLLPFARHVAADPPAWWYSVLASCGVAWEAPLALRQALFLDGLPLRRGCALVGMHVRRQDKLRGEALHVPTARFFDALLRAHPALHAAPFDLYLATDDPAAVAEAARLIQQTALDARLLVAPAHVARASPQLRAAAALPTDVLLDLAALARCDVVVCTMSSNVGRAAYLLMQQRHPNPIQSNRFISLDEGWWI